MLKNRRTGSPPLSPDIPRPHQGGEMKIASILILIGLVICCAPADTIGGDVTPMLCWGSVHIEGGQAPRGTVVEIYIGTSLGGSYVVTTPGSYGSVVVSGDSDSYGETLIYRVNDVTATKLGPDPGVFGLENQVVNLEVSAIPETKVWRFFAPGYVPRHLPDVYHGEVILENLTGIPQEIQGIYKFEDNWQHPELGEWLFWAYGAPGTTLEILEGGRYADYAISVTGPCEWEITLE